MIMKTTLVTLLLFSLALTGCAIDVGGGYDHLGYGDRGWGDRSHVDSHADQEPYHNWSR